MTRLLSIIMFKFLLICLLVTAFFYLKVRFLCIMRAKNAACIMQAAFFINSLMQGRDDP